MPKEYRLEQVLTLTPVVKEEESNIDPAVEKIGNELLEAISNGDIYLYIRNCTIAITVEGTDGELLLQELGDIKNELTDLAKKRLESTGHVAFADIKAYAQRIHQLHRSSQKVKSKHQ